MARSRRNSGCLAQAESGNLDEGQHTLHVVGSKGTADTMTVIELTANRLVIHDVKLDRQREVYIPAD